MPTGRIFKEHVPDATSLGGGAVFLRVRCADEVEAGLYRRRASRQDNSSRPASVARRHRRPSCRASPRPRRSKQTLPPWGNGAARPISLPPHGRANGWATRALLAIGTAGRARRRRLLNVGHRPSCPRAFSGCGGADAPPSAISLGRNQALRRPLPRVDRVGTVHPAGLRLDALRLILRRGTQSHCHPLLQSASPDRLP